MADMWSHLPSTGAKPSALEQSSAWIADLLSGPLAMAIVTIAIALFGFQLLKGKMRIAQGARAVLGAFLFVGSVSIAGAMMDVAPQSGALELPPPQTDVPRQPPENPDSQPQRRSPFDPYAGRSTSN